MIKSKMFKTLMTLGLISLIFPAVAVVENAGAPEVEKTKEHKKGMKPAMLEKYDADKDGALSDDEKAVMKADKAAAKAEMMKKYDSDGDGEISAEEKATMKAGKLKEKENKNQKAEVEDEDEDEDKGEEMEHEAE